MLALHRGHTFRGAAWQAPQVGVEDIPDLDGIERDQLGAHLALAFAFVARPRLFAPRLDHRAREEQIRERLLAGADNFDPGLLINQLYEELVEVEALAITADEAVTQLPPRPSGKYGRTMARLYTLVGKTSGRATAALERGEELVALHAAHLVARVPKRAPARRAR